MTGSLFRLRNRVFGINELDARAGRALSAELAEAANQLGHQLSENRESIRALEEELGGLRAELDQHRDLLGEILRSSTDLHSQVGGYLPDQKWESFDVATLARYQAGFSSAEFFNRELYGRPNFADDLSLLSHCAGLVEPGDLVLEFGSWSGRTITHLAEQLPDYRLYGFDSFEGLPEDWRTDFRKGTFRREGLPEVPGNVELVVGWFDRTLPTFLDEHPGPIGLVHVDCDLYSSTKTVLELVGPRLRDGAVIVFDEFFNYPGWEHHEYLAFQEFVADHSWRSSYVGCNPRHQQVAVQVRRTQDAS